jgi:hypothetical protein
MTVQEEVTHATNRGVDYTKCSNETISWALASLSYRERDVLPLIMAIFKGFKGRFWSYNTGSQFHGLIYDSTQGRIWQINRGTDGDGRIGKIKSWLYDLNIFTGKDGVHNGFQKLGDRAFNETKEYLIDFDTIIHTGHSQGAGVAPYVACLSAENLKGYESIFFHTFAPPPTGTSIFAARMNEHIENGNIEGTLFINPDDPIASKNLRDADSLLLDGVDVGNLAILPDVNLYDRRLTRKLLNHSCAQYNASYSLWLAKTVGATSLDGRRLFGPRFVIPYEDYKLVTLLSDLIIN